VGDLLEHRDDTYYLFTALHKAGLLETVKGEGGS